MLIAVAGGTDALSGTLSFHSLHPVVSCPPDPPNESCLRNPPGSSNATVYSPRNAARFVAQLFAARDPRGAPEAGGGERGEGAGAGGEGPRAAAGGAGQGEAAERGPAGGASKEERNG